MINWIESEIKHFEEEYAEIAESEIALKGYLGTVIRMLNGLSEIYYTQFHIYQKQILGKSMKLFCGYCLEQIREARWCNDVLQKKKYIEDIELAISEIIMIYRESVAGIGHADRRIFQSLPLDDNIYEISPKISAFYSHILEELDNIFEEKSTYAFIPHYTLKSVTEAKVLFNERVNNGKIVIIYISDGIFEKVDVATVCLIHEAFHVLSRKSRLRKERALCFVAQMLLHVKQQLFQNINFEQKDEQIKQELMIFWFREIYNVAHLYKDKEWDDKEFYGNRVKKKISQKIYEVLIDINNTLNESIIQIVTNYIKTNNYKEYKEIYQDTKKQIEMVRQNLLSMIFNNNVEKVAELFMKIFHEVYADIACVLTCDLEPSKYENAFEESILFSYDEGTFCDVNRILRTRLVTQSVINFTSNEVGEKWKEKLEKMSNPINNGNNKESVCVGQNQVGYVNVMLGEQMYELFENYAVKCTNALKKELNSLDGAQKFCNNMKQIIALPSEQLLSNVLLGNMSVGGIQNENSN